MPRVQSTVAAAAVLTAIAGSAFGATTFSTPFIKIEAEVVENGSVVSRAERVFAPDVNWSFPGGNSWDWDSSNGPMEVKDDAGNTVFAIHELGIEAHNFPMVVNNNFTTAAGFGFTNFTITSGTLAFTPFGSATASASAAITVTDTGNGSATLAGAYPGGDSYRAFFNDIDPGLLINGGLFSSQVVGGSINIPNASATFSNPGVSGPIGGSVFNMVSQFRFSLSPRDLVAGTSTYQIVPAPASIALLGLGGLVISRRRR